jgi:hypothetical protein
MMVSSSDHHGHLGEEFIAQTFDPFGASFLMVAGGDTTARFTPNSVKNSGPLRGPLSSLLLVDLLTWVSPSCG